MALLRTEVNWMLIYDHLRAGTLAYLLATLIAPSGIAEGHAGWGGRTSKPVIPWADDYHCPEKYASRLEYARECGNENWLGTINRHVAVFDGGIEFSYYKDSIPLPITNAPEILANNVEGIAPLLKLLEPFIGDTDRFNIVFDNVKTNRGPGGAIIIEFSQRIKGYKVGQGMIVRNNLQNRPVTERFRGFLIEPGIELFDTDSWVPIPEARRTAITNVYPGMPESDIENIVKDLESGALEERTEVGAAPQGDALYSYANYIATFPVRDGYNDVSDRFAMRVSVSLLDGTVDVAQVSLVWD